MKDTKYRIEWFAFYDRFGMERHLEKMAERGWMLSRLTGFYWQYRRITPAKLHFTITYFADASIFDPVLPDGQEAYLSYCQKAGWYLAANSAQFQAFYSEEEEPVPIETDAVTQVRNTHRVMMKSQVMAFILLLILSIFQLVSNLGWILDEPEIELANNMMLSIIFMCSLVFILCISQLCGYFRWYYRAKKAADLDGSFYEKTGGMWIQRLAIFFIVANMIFLIYSIAVSRLGIICGLAFATVPAVIYLSLLVRNMLVHRGVPKGINRIATFAAVILLTFIFIGGVVFVGILTTDDHSLTEREAKSKAPLLVNDLIPVDRTEYETYYNRNTSFLLDRIEVDDSLISKSDKDAPQLSYILTKIKVASIYNICRDEILNKNQKAWEDEAMGFILEQNDSLWDAEKIYQVKGDNGYALPRYIVCWEDRIAEVHFYWEPSNEEIADAAKALRNY